MRILNFGSLNVDYTYLVPHMAREGETLAASALEVYPGGKGLNQSIALSRAGAEVFHAGAVGRDGHFLVELLRKNGVDTRFVLEREGASGHAVIQVDGGGKNCILIFGGANREISVEQIETTLAQFGREDVLLVQNEISGLDHILDTAYARGIKVVLNSSPIDETLLNLPLERIACFAVNETEAIALCGSEGHLSSEELMDALDRRFPGKDLLLTLGIQGAFFQTGGNRYFEPAHPVQAMDTTGAGDTFLGYFLASWLAGKYPQAALHTASKAAAICVTRPGAAVSIPYLHEVAPDTTP